MSELKHNHSAGSDYCPACTAAPEAPKEQEPHYREGELPERQLWSKSVRERGPEKMREEYEATERKKCADESGLMTTSCGCKSHLPVAESARPERGCINHDEIRAGCPHCDLEHMARVDSEIIAKLRAERDALEKQVTQWDESFRSVEMSAKTFKSRVDAAEAEALRLRNALEKYGFHDTTCYKLNNGTNPAKELCDCGLEAALSPGVDVSEVVKRKLFSKT